MEDKKNFDINSWEWRDFLSEYFRATIPNLLNHFDHLQMVGMRKTGISRQDIRLWFNNKNKFKYYLQGCSADYGIEIDMHELLYLPDEKKYVLSGTGKRYLNIHIDIVKLANFYYDASTQLMNFQNMRRLRNIIGRYLWFMYNSFQDDLFKDGIKIINSSIHQIHNKAIPKRYLKPTNL